MGAVFPLKDALIGVCAVRIDKEGRYQGLMHPDQIEKQMKVI